MSLYTRLETESKWSNIVYSLMIKNEDAARRYMLRWQLSLDTQINYRKYLRSFAGIIKVTISTMLRDFQYRVLLGKIFTNDILYKWGKLDSDVCTLCNIERDSLVHMLITCDKIKNIWNEFTAYIETKYPADAAVCTMDPINIVCNNVHPGLGNVINLLTLVTKQYIYRVKCLRTPLRWDDIVKEFKLIEKIEERIAYNSCKMEKHCTKWNIVNIHDNAGDRYINEYLENM